MRLQDEYANFIPSKANWIAVDGDDSFWWYEVEPSFSELCNHWSPDLNRWWGVVHDANDEGIYIFNVDYRNSLEKIEPLPPPLPQKPVFYIDLEKAMAFSNKAFLGHLVLQHMKHLDGKMLNHLELFHDSSGSIRTWTDKTIFAIDHDSSDSLLEYLSKIGLRSRLEEYIEDQLKDMERYDTDFTRGEYSAYKDVLQFIEKRDE